MSKSECEKSCGTFNTEDDDCEIFGEVHPRPNNCPYFKQSGDDKITRKKRGTECQN